MRHPKRVTVDGKPHSGPVAMHTCPTTGRAAPIYRDDSVPAGQFAPIACASCGHRRDAEGVVVMLEEAERMVRAVMLPAGTARG